MDIWVFVKFFNEIYGLRILSFVYKLVVIFNIDGWLLCDIFYFWRD